MVARLLEVQRARDPFRQVAAVKGRCDAVAEAVDHQCRHVNRRQRGADVDLADHCGHAQECAGGDRQALEPREQLAGVRVGGPARQVPLDAVAAAPVVRRDVAQGLVHLDRRLAAGIVRCGEPAGGRRAEDQRGDLLRVGHGEQDAHRRAFRVAEQHGHRRPGGAHHGAHVGHALLERQVAYRAVRQAGVALVEQDQPAERRQPLEEPGRVCVLPQQVEVAHQAGDEHDIPVALAENLVGDVHAVVGQRVAGPRDGERLAALHSPAAAGVLLARCGAIKGGVLAQDAGVQVAERRAGLDGQFAGQDRAQVTVGAQRVGLPAGPVQGEHPQRPELFAQRVGRGQRLEFRDRVAELAAFQQRPGPRFERGEPQFLEAAGLGPDGRRVDARQGRPAPQPQRLVEAVQGDGRVPAGHRIGRLGRQLGETAGVEFRRGHAQQVSRRPGAEPVRGRRVRRRSQRLAQLGHAHLETGQRPVSRLQRPQLVEQLPGSDDVIGVHDQRREHGAGAGAAQLERPSAHGHVDGTQDAEFHGKYTVSRSLAARKTDRSVSGHVP
jgi:hypothetical protein